MRINAARLALRVSFIGGSLQMRNGESLGDSLTRCNGQNGIHASITGMLCPLLKLDLCYLERIASCKRM
jgi:hypothetical protein